MPGRPSVQLLSALRGQGVDEVRQKILDWFAGA